MIDTVVRTKRKTVCITIDSKGKVVAQIPERMTLKQLDFFAQKHSEWIKKHKANKLNELRKHSELYEYKRIMYRGKAYQTVVSPDIKKSKLQNDSLLVPLSKVYPSKTQSSEELEARLRIETNKWLVREAEEVLVKDAEGILERLGLDATLIRLSNTKGSWGTCNAKKVYSLNWRCIMLSDRLKEYILLHEAMHLRELNHSSRFWALMTSVMPDCKQRKRELKEFSFLLELYR